MENDHKTIYVKCTFTIPVEVPDNTKPGWEDYDEFFDIEDNHCPGTGSVGAAIDARIKWGDDNHFCWACGLDGKCEIVDTPSNPK